MSHVARLVACVREGVCYWWECWRWTPEAEGWACQDGEGGGWGGARGAWGERSSEELRRGGGMEVPLRERVEVGREVCMYL